MLLSAATRELRTHLNFLLPEIFKSHGVELQKDLLVKRMTCFVCSLVSLVWFLIVAFHAHSSWNSPISQLSRCQLF